MKCQLTADKYKDHNEQYKSAEEGNLLSVHPIHLIFPIIPIHHLPAKYNKCEELKPLAQLERHRQQYVDCNGKFSLYRVL